MSKPLVFLDDARPCRERVSLFTDCANVIAANETGDAIRALEAIERGVRGGLHAAGYFSYELGYLLEPHLSRLLPKNRSVPLLWFGMFRNREEVKGDDIGAWFKPRTLGRAYAGPLRYAETRESYAKKFTRVADYIGAGDAYQVNLTFPAHFAFMGDPLALYARLRARMQGGHGAFIHDGTRSVLSFSPELFFRIEDGRLTAKPMKGTAPRGQDAAEDARLARRLRESEKDRAENLMIVDLIRNDLGRVAKLGSVKVVDPFTVETYPTVHQMVSTVTAELRETTGIAELVRALFPCGSVTGAPKIRAMEIIAELEATPRGVYCGAVGSFSPDGAAEFNVAIRTLTIQGNDGVLGVGGGLVADSREAAEYEECLIKARYFSEDRPPISLVETLGFYGRGFVRGERHLSRLENSAKTFGIPFDGKAVKRALAQATDRKSCPLRVRLELHEDGATGIRVADFTPVPDTVWTYAISGKRVQSGDLLARHKTSWRTLYDTEFERLRAATGCDQALFLNECGEAVEGNVTNIFLRRNGRLLTPPLTSGALDGCLRRELLERGECVETVLTFADLKTGETYFGNSLRGLIRAVPVPQAI